MSDALHEIMLLRFFSGVFSMLNYDAFKASDAGRRSLSLCGDAEFHVARRRSPMAIRDYPKIDMGGLFLPEAAPYGPAFAQLLEELEGPEVRKIMEEKLGIDLTGRPTMVTVRSNCQAKDGRIHADAKFKLGDPAALSQRGLGRPGRQAARAALRDRTSRITRRKSRRRVGSPLSSAFRPTPGTAINALSARAAM